MKLTIEITMDNAAVEGREDFETRLILDDILSLVSAGRITLSVASEGPLFDTSGNRVGKWEVTQC